MQGDDEGGRLFVEANANAGAAPYTIHLRDGRTFVIDTDADAELLWQFTGLAILARMGPRAPGAVVSSMVPIVISKAHAMLGASTEALKNKLKRERETIAERKRDPRCMCSSGMTPGAGHDMRCPAAKTEDHDG